jgi:hypothetical protein
MKDTSIDTGCGVYGASVIIPPSHPTVWQQQCYAVNQFRNARGTDKEQVRDGAKAFCEHAFRGDATMGTGDKAVIKVFTHDESGGGSPFDSPNDLGYNPDTPLRYDIHWAEGCPTVAGGERFNLAVPVAGAKGCMELFFDSYRNCK